MSSTGRLCERANPAGPGTSPSPCAFDTAGWLLGAYLPGARCSG